MSAIVNNLFAFLVAALVFSTGFYAVPAQAQQNHKDVIIKMLTNRDAEIKRILGDETEFSDAQRDKLKHLINGAIDFEKMGQDGSWSWSALPLRLATEPLRRPPRPSSEW